MLGNGNFEKFSKRPKKFSYDAEENSHQKMSKKELRRQRRLQKEREHWQDLEKKED